MKTFLSLVTVVGFTCVAMQGAIANEAAATSTPVSESAVYMEINPFMHSKRVTRTDRVSYPVTKTEKPAAKIKSERVIRTDRVSYTNGKPEVKSFEKKRIIRNDRVILTQVIDPS